AEMLSVVDIRLLHFDQIHVGGLALTLAVIYLIRIENTEIKKLRQNWDSFIDKPIVVLQCTCNPLATTMVIFLKEEKKKMRELGRELGFTRFLNCLCPPSEMVFNLGPNLLESDNIPLKAQLTE
ncbi:hypothetical protein HAX54_048062, partial [Datura stramonium]|nr:hypothetical protein [Datura stramonium]